MIERVIEDEIENEEAVRSSQLRARKSGSQRHVDFTCSSGPRLRSGRRTRSPMTWRRGSVAPCRTPTSLYTSRMTVV